MPRHTFKTNVPQIKMKKPNYQNLMIIVVFVVGGFLVYRMISSVQRQLLMLKQDVSNLKEENTKNQQQIVESNSGFEVSFEENDGEDDEVSIDSVDIDKIMQKLTTPEDNTIKSGYDFADICKKIESNSCDDISVHESKEEETDVETSDEKSVEIPEVTDKIVEIEEDLSKKSLAELKKMLKDKGLSTKGNKAQLLEALKSIG